MDFIEFSRSEILILSNILRLVRKETGLPLKMQNANFLKRLDTAMIACQDQKTHKLYNEFLDIFSQQDVLQKLGITGRAETSDNQKTLIYRGQEKTSESETPPSSNSDDQKTETPKGKRKIIYRGQVKYID